MSKGESYQHEAAPSGDGLPGQAEVSPGEGDSGTGLEEKVDDLHKMVRSLLHGRTPIPKTRKYIYEEAAFRLQYGLDPRSVDEKAREEMQKECLSKKVIGRLTRDGDCPLQRVKIGGSTFVTEASIQHYEKGVAMGWVKGYQVPQPRKYRK